MFLVLFVAVALLSVTAVCLPLLRGTKLVAERGQFDRIVYRDQLREVDRDLSRGVLSMNEAASARLEIQRRLLSVDTLVAAGRTAWSAPSPMLAALVMLLMLGGATALYLNFGSPSLPDAPFASRAAQQDAAAANSEHIDMRAAAERLEQKLKANPSDGEGWVLYAKTQAMLGNWPQAVAAYRRAVELGQKNADVLAGYGEMQVLSASGIVAPAAHDTFVEALAADPKNDVARYYLAVADAQAGNEKQAIERWLDLAADIPDDSPMRDAIARGVAEAAKSEGVPAPALPKGVVAPQAQPENATVPGPNQDQMNAASQMSDAQRKQMVQGMVTELAARLEKQPNDLEGWLRLGRSYAVLGDMPKAAAAFDHAAALQPDDASIKLQEFQALVAHLQPSDPLPPRAVELLHQVAALSPDQPEVLWYLGVEAARGGRPDEARQAWTKLLGLLPPGGEDAKLVKTAIEALPKS